MKYVEVTRGLLNVLDNVHYVLKLIPEHKWKHVELDYIIRFVIIQYELCTSPLHSLSVVHIVYQAWSPWL